MSNILTTQQLPGGSNPNTDVIVTSGNSVVVDVILFTTLSAVKWCVTASTATQMRMIEVSATYSDTAQLRVTKFGDVGDRLKVDFNVVCNNHQLQLSIDNNEELDVIVTAARLASVSR